MKRLWRLLVADGKVNPAGGSGTKEARESACTPKWLADLIGRVDLDPASNDRSHINAYCKLTLERRENGLHDYGKVDRSYRERPGGWDIDRTAIASTATRVFCNPPYARGQVIKWVKHWRSTNFIFLLRWDPSTEWFAELIHHCTHVWFPGRRINFEPPPGVTFSSNPFPHALYLRNPSEELIGRLTTAGYLMPVDEFYLDTYFEADEQRHFDGDDEAGDEGEGAKGGAGGSGGGTGGNAPKVQSKAQYIIDELAKWLPASEPPKTKWTIDDFKYTLKYDQIPKYYTDPYRKAERKTTGCGACPDCVNGRSQCGFKTEQEYRRYIKLLQGW